MRCRPGIRWIWWWVLRLEFVVNFAGAYRIVDKRPEHRAGLFPTM